MREAVRSRSVERVGSGVQKVHVVFVSDVESSKCSYVDALVAGCRTEERGEAITVAKRSHVFAVTFMQKQQPEPQARLHASFVENFHVLVSFQKLYRETTRSY